MGGNKDLIFKMYVAKIEVPSDDDEDWELQGCFGDFREAVMHASDIERRSKTPIVIMDSGSFKINGRYRNNQPILCWWSENYYYEMEKYAPSERGHGWHYLHGYVDYEFHDEADSSKISYSDQIMIQPSQLSQPSQHYLAEQLNDDVNLTMNRLQARKEKSWTRRFAEAIYLLLRLFFLVPGRAILWYEYMYPARGKVYASGRRYKSDVAAVIAAIGFYASLIFFVVVTILVVNHNR